MRVGEEYKMEEKSMGNEGIENWRSVGGNR